MNVVCCQVEVLTSGLSPVQKSPTICGVSEYDRQASIMRLLGLLEAVALWGRILLLICV